MLTMSFGAILLTLSLALVSLNMMTTAGANPWNGWSYLLGIVGILAGFGMIISGI